MTSTVGCSLLIATNDLADGTAAPTLEGGPAADAGGGDDGGAPPSSGGDAGVSETYRSAVLSDGPIAYWRLNAPPGTSVLTNEVPGGPSAVLAGGVTLGVEGAFGKDDDTAAAFDGAGALTVEEDFEFAGNAPYTLEAWVRPTVASDHSRIIADQRSNNTGYRLLLDDGELKCGRCTSTSKCNDTTPSVPPPLGVFAHVACTYDGTTVRLYVDGIQRAQASLPEPIVPSSDPFAIGAQHNTSEGFFGTIDEVAIYDKALGSERIAAHFAAGRP